MKDYPAIFSELGRQLKGIGERIESLAFSDKCDGALQPLFGDMLLSEVANAQKVTIAITSAVSEQFEVEKIETQSNKDGESAFMSGELDAVKTKEPEGDPAAAEGKKDE